MQSLSSTLLLGLVTVLSAQLHLSAPYSVSFVGRTGDTITIACKNGSADSAKIDFEVATEVGIYVNFTQGVRDTSSRNLEDMLGTGTVIRRSTDATFRITQDVEGYYSCGPPDAPISSHEPPQAKLLIGEWLVFTLKFAGQHNYVCIIFLLYIYMYVYQRYR